MPELPEVETVRRALEPVLLGKFITDIQQRRSDLRYPLPDDMAKIICRNVIVSIERRAKYLLLKFEHGWTMAWHLGMSGRILLFDADSSICIGPHDHLIFNISQGYRLVYNDPRRFGFIKLLSSALLLEHKQFANIGPEPLGDLKELAEYFHTRSRKRTVSIKSMLLDQNIIAGIGNIYASEALWYAKILPLRAVNTITLQEFETLLSCLQSVLYKAIESGGSTLRDHRLPNGETGSYQDFFKAYAKDGQQCQHCKIIHLIKIIQNGRATYYCPACQK